MGVVVLGVCEVFFCLRDDCVSSAIALFISKWVEVKWKAWSYIGPELVR